MSSSGNNEADKDTHPIEGLERSKKRGVSRRRFIGLAGAAAGAIAVGGSAYFLSQNGIQTPGETGPRRVTTLATPKNAQNYIPEDYLEFIRFLESVSDQTAGKTIRVALEAEVGPRALFRNKIDFTSSLGITLLMEFDIYRNNLAKSLLAVSTRSPTFDVFNIDVSQVGRFASHIIPIAELLESFPELTFSNLELDDFLDPVKAFSATYPPDLILPPWNIPSGTFKGVEVQVGQETPIYLRFYRKDLYQEEGRELSVTWDEYLEDVKHFHNPSRARWGTVLMAARFPAVIEEWHNWLYSFGGKLWDIGRDGIITSAVNSDLAVAALEHYVEVGKFAEPNSAFYGWSPAAESLAKSRATMSLNISEFAASMDIPGQSFVVRDIGFAKNPRGEAGSSHHYTGAGLAVSRYSRNPGLAWLFVQWATLAATQVIVALDPLALGTPTRKGVFEDSHVKGLINEGTIRHFDPAKAAFDAGEINFKPGFPNWDSVEALLFTKLHEAVLEQVTPREALNEVKRLSDENGPFTF
ncbi:MAG: extracellular solute-binding protein [Thaumarchaeota archaeon]|nr:extracellular solute-binding protein [Nitrososphaerota archaeon]